MGPATHESPAPAGHSPGAGTVRRAGPTVAPLLTLDPDLGDHLTGARRAAAERELLVRVAHVPVGRWDPERYLGPGPANLGLLLVRGLVTRELRVEDTTSAELLASGDLVKAAAGDDHSQTLSTPLRWTALTPTRAAVLDAGVLAQLLNRFPEVLLALIQRLEGRARHLALTQAISQMTGVDRRLEAFFWYMADRWGRVTPEGVLVPLQLSHRLLASLVGARRPTVSTALAGLAARGCLRRHPAGWLLTGPAPADAPADESFVPHRRRFADDGLSRLLVA